MKINFNNISFKKQLKANCSLIKEDRPFPCCIYKLDKYKDRDYFYTLSKNPNWQNGKFLRSLDEILRSPSDDFEIYVIEDKEQNCLGYCSVDKLYGSMNLMYLATKPSNEYKNKDRKIKYTGETMLSFLAGLLKKRKGQYIYIPSIMPESYNFYKKNCHFSQYNDYFGSFMLRSEYADNLIEQNKKHTGTPIEYIG